MNFCMYISFIILLFILFHYSLTQFKFWMWKVVFFLGMVIPFPIHTHLFILFSHLFTNPYTPFHYLLYSYLLHPYYIYKYTLLTTQSYKSSLTTYLNEFTHTYTLFHHFLFFYLLYSLFLISLDFSSPL